MRREITPDPNQSLTTQIISAKRSGADEIVLNGDFSAKTPKISLLTLANVRDLNIDGTQAILNGNFETLHVLQIGPNAHNIDIDGLEITGGNTANEAAQDLAIAQHQGPRVSIFQDIDGAGVLIVGDTSAVFENCHIHHNQALQCGGGVSLQQTPDGNWTEFNNCTINNNTAGHTGSAVDVLTGGSKLLVVDSLIKDNDSNCLIRSGGPHGQVSIFPDSFAVVERCTISHLNGIRPAIDYQKGLGRVHFADNSLSGVGIIDSGKNRTPISERLADLIMLKDEVRKFWKVAYPWITPQDSGKIIYQAALFDQGNLDGVSTN